MDTATVQRFLDGMKYEAERTAPPPGFPQLPDIPGGSLHESAISASSSRHISGAAAGCMRAMSMSCPTPGSFLLWKKTGTPILHRARQGRRDPRVLQHLPAPRRPAGQDRLRQGRRVRLRLPRLDLRARRQAGQFARQARLSPDLDLATRPLIGVRCERFYNWIFINEDPDARAASRARPAVPRLFPAVRARLLALRDARKASTSSATSRCCSTRFSRSII